MWPSVAGPVRWGSLAMVMLGAAAILLFRSSPLPVWCFLPGLLVLPWARTARTDILLGIALSTWLAWSYNHAWQARVSEPIEILELRGIVAGEVTPAGSGLRFDLRPQDSDLGRLRVAWYRDAPKIQQGECWVLRLRVRPPRGAVNPGGLDYEAWLFREGIVGLATVKSGQLCDDAVTPMALQSSDWREELTGYGSNRAIATLSALLWGDRSKLNDADWDVLRRTGTSHLFAISGLHIGLMAGVAYFFGVLLWKLWLYRWWPRAVDCGAVAAAIAAVSYAAVSGFGLPAQRALIMCLLGLLVVVSGRRRALFAMLSLAMVVVLAFDPFAVLTPGFWLSFVAVLGIVSYLHIYPRLSRWRQLLGIQVLLTVLLMPLTLLFFGGVSWLSFGVNLLLVPLFAIILPMLFVLTGIHVLTHWTVPLEFALGGLDSLWQVLDYAAAWPWAYQAYAQPSIVLAGIIVLGILGLLWVGWWLRSIGIVILLAMLLQAGESPKHGDFRLWLWDVGQGLSALIQTSEHAVLYDAGPAWPGGFDAGERLLVPALKSVGIRALDDLIISHGDMDHRGGANSILKNFDVGQHYGSGGSTECRTGQHWEYDGVRFAFLHPEKDGGQDNNHSCVMRVEGSTGTSVLLTGDVEHEAEAALLIQPELLASTVLVVPHHGSNSSSTDSFLSAVQPRWALVPAGFQNRWGFPKEAVRARYASAGIPLWVSGESGAIRVEVGKILSLRALRDDAPRLWRYPVSKP